MMLSTLIHQQASQLSNWTSASMISFIMILISIGLMKGMEQLENIFDKRAYDEK